MYRLFVLVSVSMLRRIVGLQLIVRPRFAPCSNILTNIDISDINVRSGEVFISFYKSTKQRESCTALDDIKVCYKVFTCHAKRPIIKTEESRNRLFVLVAVSMLRRVSFSFGKVPSHSSI
ncbi:hypothetical protein SISNIDRAFT_301445 [Sistotremastrum niveocremeum HHB9708]|uniref:Secreted protein n=1 Tax=Sistotremastrum niveocremeum HHB9708 TaxID=1314777 RepID=A0A164N7T4_9AGAM|nr:hypothetical protein SISNIDRAFT_301445 [Sistotremastrum niveocremeum HHB9708]